MSILFSDKELDDMDARYKRALEDRWDAYNEELNALQKRVDELERAFCHHHSYNPESGDNCIKCGFDLRDPIHLRVSDPRESKS